MLKLTKTRNYLELRVGANAAVDVVLYLRRTDLEWFHHTPHPSDNDANDKMDHTTDLFQVLEQTVLPRMLQREIEDSHYKSSSTSSSSNNNDEGNKDVSKKPPPLGPGGIPILAAAEQTQKTAKQQELNMKKGGTKRKRQTAKEKATAAAVFHEQAKQDNKREKDVYYAFGQTLQLAYRWQDNTKDSSPSSTATKSLSRHNSASFVFDNKSSSSNNGSNKRGILRQLDKLPKRLEAWVFPFDPTKPNETDPTDGGFPLPERIPVAHLFRGGDGGSTDGKFDEGNDNDKAS